MGLSGLENRGSAASSPTLAHFPLRPKSLFILDFPDGPLYTKRVKAASCTMVKKDEVLPNSDQRLETNMLSRDQKQAGDGLGLHPIGIIRSPFTNPVGTPIQPAYAQGKQGQVILEDQYETALDDIEGFERLWLIYWMDRVSEEGRRVKRVHPRGREELPLRGVFATRSPYRPNPLGLTTVSLLAREGNRLRVRGLDALNGTPVVDIKPYTDCDQPRGSEAPARAE